MRFSVCTDAVLRHLDTVSAMAALADLQITSYEFWSWWDKDLDAIEQAQRRLGLQLVALCTRFISLVDPAQRSDYLAGLSETIQVARRLGCRRIISQVGNELPDISRARQRRNLIDGLRACLPLLQAADLTLLFEPLNTRRDHAGYYLWSADEAFAIARAVNNPRVKVLYDIYHQQIMEGDLLTRIASNQQLIGHFHAAGCPGRHELPTGEIAYQQLLPAVSTSGYAGYVGLEYFPLGDALQSLRELRGTYPDYW